MQNIGTFSIPKITPKHMKRREKEGGGAIRSISNTQNLRPTDRPINNKVIKITENIKLDLMNLKIAT